MPTKDYLKSSFVKKKTNQETETRKKKEREKKTQEKWSTIMFSSKLLTANENISCFKPLLGQDIKILQERKASACVYFF